MKPNDKAIEAAATSLFGNYMGGEKKWVGDAIAAAYAAQFQSEDYAGLIARLRDDANLGDPICDEAADALEAVLAEREAWKGRQEATATILKQVESERDALAARLAPVDDRNLEILAAKEWIEATTDMPPRTTYTISERSLAGARAAIAAIRPHIEAVERERCAKVADKRLRAENKRLREALKETLAIARRNEAGDYVDRALAALEGVTKKEGAGNE